MSIFLIEELKNINVCEPNCEGRCSVCPQILIERAIEELQTIENSDKLLVYPLLGRH